MSDEPQVSPRITAFLAALPHAKDDELVGVPGLATYRAKHVRRGLEREVIVVHSSGLGFAFLTPPGHVGMCPHCAARKGNVCEHCSCALCSWTRQSEERASPRISREKLQALARQLQTFRLGNPTPRPTPAIDDDI